MQNPNLIGVISLFLIIVAIVLAWQKHYYFAWGMLAAEIGLLAYALKAGRGK